MKPVRFVSTARDDLAAFPSRLAGLLVTSCSWCRLEENHRTSNPCRTLVRVCTRSGYVTSRMDIEVARRRYRLIGGQLTKTTRKPHGETSGNIFIDLGFPPHEAAVMLLRCELAEALRKWIDREGITQAQAAGRLGVAQPRIF